MIIKQTYRSEGTHTLTIQIKSTPTFKTEVVTVQI